MRCTFFLLLIFLPLAALGDEPLSLASFLHEVRAENLSLKAEDASLEAAQANAGAIGIPAPMIGITRLTEQGGVSGGLEISQTIPFPTKLISNHSARAYSASASEALQEAKIREVLAEAKLLYFRLWEAQQKTIYLEEKKRAVTEHLKLAQAATRSDSFLRIHLLTAESDLDLLENDLIQAEQEKRERQIEVAEFLNRDPALFRPLASEIPRATLPEKESLALPSQLKAKKLELESLNSRVSEARSQWLPDISLRYREMDGTAMSPRSSEVMVAATLPFVFFWDPRSASAKAGAERLQGEFMLAKEQRKTDVKRELLVSRAKALERQLEQFQKLLAKAEKRMRLVHNVAPRDMETLQNHRETMEAFPDLKLKALSLRDQYEETVAELEKLVGGI